MKIQTKKQIKYCRDCGKPKELVWTGSFNEETGEKRYSYMCKNPYCKTGCANMGGHFFGWFTSVCSRCGAYDAGCI